MSLPFTTITSHFPSRLAKRYELDRSGSLVPQSAGSVGVGHAQHDEAADLHDLAKKLDELQPSQAVTWGRPVLAAVQIVSSRRLRDRPGDYPGAITRGRETFHYPAGAAVMMLDHDAAPPGWAGFSAETLRGMLCAACPALAGAPMLIRPSASAGIVGPDGRVFKPWTRWRIYLPVSRGTDIPEAGQRLATLLWAAGFGWIEPSTAGSALERTILDLSVWQPERLDFAARPVLEPPLSRAHGWREVIGDPRGLFDLNLIHVTGDHLTQAVAARAQGLEAARPALDAARGHSVPRRAASLAATGRMSLEEATAAVTGNLDRRALEDTFPLRTSEGQFVTVADLLAKPERYHETRFYDPEETADGSDSRVAVA
jgi:hypothetical protein